MNTRPIQVLARLTRLGCLLGLTCLLIPGAGAFTFTRTSSPVFYMDTSVTPTLQGMYVSYQILNNSAVSYPDLWVKADTFTGGIISLGPNEDGVVQLGAMAPGQTKTAFIFLQASAATTTPQSHTVRIYPTRPPAGELASQTFSMTAEETIQANANQVTTVVAGPNPPQLGGLVTVTVIGESGTIGASKVMSFNPAAYLSWRPDAYQLVSSSITLSGGNSGSYTDTLFLVASNSVATDYTAVYTYRAVGSTQTPTPVSPISFISSGTQIKHTWVTDLVSFDPVLPVDNKMALSKAASPSQLISTGLVTFTLTTTNTGPIESVLEDYVDTLPSTPGTPTYVSGSSRFNGAVIPDPVVSGATLTWVGVFSIPSGATRTLTFQALMPPFEGIYTNRAVGHIGTSQIDTTFALADNVPATATVQMEIPVVSGAVYLDANQNAQRDAGENGTGLTLFAKLLSNGAPSGPALQAIAVHPATGYYGFTNVAPGLYVILVDNNAILSDVTPTLPAGWIGTEMPGQIRTNVVVSSIDVPNQNFGLAGGIPVSGLVFADTGFGGGTAHDGTLNGGESGLAGVTLRLTDGSGSTVYSTATTDGAGAYAMVIPPTVPLGAALRVAEVNASGSVSVSGNAGNTGGTYTRATDLVSFTLVAGSVYTNVSFGDVPLNTFVPNGQQSGSPGGFVVYAHIFTAGSAGQVTFVVSNQPNPALPGWAQVLYRDADCNAQLEASDPILASPVTVAAGERICLLVKETIPLSAPFGAQDVLTVTARFDYAGATPSLSATNTVTDVTTVGSPPTAGLTLVKSADKAVALPGEVITYTVVYANTSSEALRNLVLYDSTPAYTTFLSATNGPLATNLTSVTITAPAIGASGSVQWQFTGDLAPGRSGFVRFQVGLQQ